MSRVVLESALLSKLANLVQPVELCDESGRVVGQFTPAFVPVPSDLEPQVSNEELQRRLAGGGGRTLEQILSDLEKRG